MKISIFRKFSKICSRKKEIKQVNFLVKVTLSGFRKDNFYKNLKNRTYTYV